MTIKLPVVVNRDTGAIEIHAIISEAMRSWASHGAVLTEPMESLQSQLDGRERMENRLYCFTGRPH